MRLLLAAVALALVVTGCGGSTDNATPTAVAPVPTTSAAPTVVLPSVTTTVTARPRPSSTPSFTQAQITGFLGRLHALNEPSVNAADPNTLLTNGQDVCTSIAKKEGPEEIILDTTAAFDVSIGNAQKIIDAARATLCK